VIYARIENFRLKADTWKELVRQLYHLSFDEDAHTKSEYMSNMKERIEEVYQRHIVVKDFEGFVRELADLSLLKIFTCAECKHHVDVPMGCTAGLKPNRRKVECAFMAIQEVDDCEELK
jgi:hypothetical protein